MEGRTKYKRGCWRVIGKDDDDDDDAIKKEMSGDNKEVDRKWVNYQKKARTEEIYKRISMIK